MAERDPDVVRVRGYAVIELRRNQGSDGADVEGVGEALRLARRMGGRLGELRHVDAAVDVEVADHEAPVAVTPVSDAKTQSDHGEREIAEEQSEPLQGGRVEAEPNFAKRRGF